MSALISGVKNGLSKAGFIVLGFPLSHVQSANENGSEFFADPEPELGATFADSVSFCADPAEAAIVETA
jgi:hypothetical protein